MTLLALAGLLGSGKSSVVLDLARSDDTLSCFVEPEQESYPDFVVDGTSDFFGVHSWFRASRVYDLYRAHRVSAEGGTALVDSYYDRMLASYVRRPEFGWLLGDRRTHLDALAAVSAADRRALPRADHIIFLEVSEDVWVQRLKSRMRGQDETIRLRDRHAMQAPMLDACEQIAADDGSTLTVIETSALTVQEVSQAVRHAALPIRRA